MVFFQIMPYAVALAFLLMLGLVVQLIRVGLAAFRFQTLTRRIRAVVWLYSVLNGLAAFTWITTFIEILPLRTRIPITDYGAPLGAVTVFMLVPIALPICRSLKRKGRIGDAPQILKSYTQLSNVFLLFSLFPGIHLILFYTLLLASGR
ncbi:MAG: hypothetical protein ACR2OX_12605 [Methyloligellaceae bacterium]